ncbi:MAG: transcriptional regulator [SAR324 cluster bacterium]|nr:transcriptional regulator [SAR324 cluster bacterium]
MKKWMPVLFTITILPALAQAELPLGKMPVNVVLSGDDGGYVDGRGAFDSAELIGKLNTIFYVDPDEKDLNNKASEALKGDQVLVKAREEGKSASYAIINMAATWLPNAVLTGLIEDSQKEHPNTHYVFDMNEVLHKKWGIATDSSDVIVINKEGNVVFSKDGELSDADIQTLLKTIHENL